jgi:hypothetical protein
MYCNANSSLTERTTLRCGLQFGAQNGVRMTRTRALRCFDVLAPPFARPDTPVVPDRDDAVSLHESHSRHRPHRSLELAPPNGRLAIENWTDTQTMPVRRRDRLGGLLHEYERAA